MFIPGSLWFQAIGFGFLQGVVSIATTLTSARLRIQIEAERGNKS